MNKPICILLCILLISLSVVPVFATDYVYTTRSAFCTAINSELSFTANTYTSSYFIDTIGSDYSNLLSSLITNYSLSDDSNFRFLVLCDLGSYKWIYLMTFDNDDYYVYQTNLNATTPSNNFVFSEATNLDIYHVNNANNTLTYSHTTPTNKTTYTWSPTQKARFAGMYPYNASVKTSSSAVNTFVLNLSDAPSPSDPVNPGYDFDPFVLPPYIISNAASYAPVMDYYTTTILPNLPNYDPNNPEGGYMATMAYYTYMWEYYNRWYMNSHLRYLSSFYDKLEHLSSMSDNIELLASVYASEQEIEAREAAANNQQAIVDNFLDSEGEGYVSPSDISSVSSMSDGYKTHMSTDAQPSGIWNIFNSNNFGWFSQETVNQLDTTTSNQRGVNTFETPYLDEKIRDIYKSLGVNYDD